MLKPRFYFIIPLLLFFLTVGKLSFAQTHPNYVQIMEEKGLESNSINNIYVSKSGLLYIAHSKGLSSFDGNTFVNYYNRDFPFTEVTNIMETSEGKIFCKAFNNSIFYLQNDSLIHYKDIFTKLGFIPSSCFKNLLLSVQNDSLLVINTIDNTSKAIPVSNDTVGYLKQSSPIFIGNIMTGKNAACFLVDSQLRTFRLPRKDFYLGKYYFSNGQVFFLPKTKASNILHLNKDIYLAIPADNSSSIVNYISQTDSTIWICTNKGIFYKNIYNANEAFTHILPNLNTTSVQQTTERNFFVSTIGSGLIFIPSFSVQSFNIKEPTSINCINNDVLISSENGDIFNYQHHTNQFKKLSNHKALSPIRLLIKDTITNSLLICGINTIINNYELPFSVKDYCYVKNNLLLATTDGIYLLNKEKKSTATWLANYILKTFRTGIPHLYKLSFSNEHTSNVKYNETENTIYIGNYTGLFKMQQGYSVEKKMPEPGCVLKDICVLNGTLFLASKDKGLLKWNGLSYEQAFKNIPTDGILYKLEVYKDELWILGENAIFCYKNNELFRFADAIGIKARKLLGISVNDDYVFLNSINEIIKFPKNIQLVPSGNPKFLLTKVTSINNKLSLTNNSSLNFTNNFINFQFSLICYSNPSNSHVAYSINDQPIIHLAANDRTLQLSQLKPDEYCIRFYVVSNNRITKEPVSQFTFTISPPFYNSWWFYTLCTIILSLAGYTLVKYRIKKIKQELSLKQSKALLKNELDKSILLGIKAQMNPHFIFNALNTIQSYVYMNDKRNAGKYISKFSDLTRSILDMSNKEYITLQDEINALELYLSLEKMRFEDSFEYKIESNPLLKKEAILIPSMFIQPYVENAIKHGLLHRKTNRTLYILFNQDGSNLEITIDDNGIGRKRSQEINKANQNKHQSFAVEANKKRLDILKQHFQNINLEFIDKYSPLGEALGTKVIITLPLEFAK